MMTRGRLRGGKCIHNNDNDDGKFEEEDRKQRRTSNDEKCKIKSPEKLFKMH